MGLGTGPAAEAAVRSAERNTTCVPLCAQECHPYITAHPGELLGLSKEETVRRILRAQHFLLTEGVVQMAPLLGMPLVADTLEEASLEQAIDDTYRAEGGHAAA